MNDNYDEILEVLFSGYMRNFTMVFYQIKGSKYGKGCSAVNNILDIERYKVHVLYGENGKSVLKVIKNVIINYKSKPNYVIMKHGNPRISSYKYQMVGHNASGFDNYTVMNSLPSSHKCIKIFETSYGKLKLSLKTGSVIEDDRPIPK